MEKEDWTWLAPSRALEDKGASEFRSDFDLTLSQAFPAAYPNASLPCQSSEPSP